MPKPKHPTPADKPKPKRKNSDAKSIPRNELVALVVTIAMIIIAVLSELREFVA